MKVQFTKYRLNVMEVMIGTPRAAAGDAHIDTVFEQLRSRQVAKEQAATHASQQEAAVKERELNEARAIGAAKATATKAPIRGAWWAGCRAPRAIAGSLTDAIKNAKQPLMPGIVMGAGRQASMTDRLMSIAVANGPIGRALENPPS